MSTRQQRLTETYRKRWPALIEGLGAFSTRRKISRPFLMNLDAHEYAAAQVKLMVVGQQTYGWGEDIPRKALATDGIDRLLGLYDDFGLGKDYGRSPFWAAAHSTYRALNPDAPENGFLWNNVLKLDEGGERPDADVEALQAKVFNVLADELDIAQPHAVVFFTGPTYDGALEAALPGIAFEKVRGYDQRELAQVRHPKLPPAGFRTYHPGYLRRAGRWALVERLPALIRRALDGAGS
jgi:hypothetical protein